MFFPIRVLREIKKKKKEKILPVQQWGKEAL